MARSALILFVGFVLGGLEWVSSPGARPASLTFDVTVGWAFVAASAVTIGRVNGRAPWLFFFAGVVWLIGGITGIALSAAVGPLVHLLATYPTGRTRTAIQRMIVIAGYVTAVVDVVTPTDAAVLPLIAAAACSSLILASRSAAPLRRGRLSGALAGLSLAGALAAASWTEASGSIGPALAESVSRFALVVTAVWLAFDLRWGGWVEDSLARLIIDLGDSPEPATLRDRLRSALHDERLVLGYALPGQPGFVDEEGAAVSPPDAGDGRVAIPLIADGEQIGVVLRTDDQGDIDDSLIAGVAAAARIAVGNVMLTEETQHQLDDLEASRSRLMLTVDAQRARALSEISSDIVPRLAGVRDLLATSAQESALRLVGDVDDIVAQLRDLAAGSGPIELRADGLAAAVRTLAERCPMPVRVAITVTTLDPSVETTAWFVCAEGLANASKHSHAASAWIEIRPAEASITVEIGDDGRGGVRVDHGSGLVGLRERVERSGGTLDIDERSGPGARLIAHLVVGAGDATSVAATALESRA